MTKFKIGYRVRAKDRFYRDRRGPGTIVEERGFLYNNKTVWLVQWDNTGEKTTTTAPDLILCKDPQMWFKLGIW